MTTDNNIHDFYYSIFTIYLVSLVMNLYIKNLVLKCYNLLNNGWSLLILSVLVDMGKDQGTML